MTDKIATVPWSIPGVLSGGPGGAWGSGKSAQRKTGRPVSRSAKDTILRMSKTLEKWLPEELSRFHPCAVAEFDAFALGIGGVTELYGDQDFESRYPGAKIVPL